MPSSDHLTTDLSWQNIHENFTQPIRGMYEPMNPAAGAIYDRHRTSAAAIQEMIQDAMAGTDRLRGLGGRWSLSEAAATAGFQLDNRRLDLLLPLTPPMVQGDTENLVLVQAGIRINVLNRLLFEQGKSLKTSGASDGQTLAGAVSTGTHGAALHFGATPDFVVGMQLATGADKTLWIERSSQPQATDELLSALDADLLRDDEVFNAAVVSFGSFGAILALMIEVRELFTLMERRDGHPLDDRLREALATGDPSGLDHPSAGVTPHHLDIVVNPYSPGDADQTLVTVMHEIPASECVQAGPRLGSVGDVASALVDFLGAHGLGLSTFLPGFPDDPLVWFTRNFDDLDRGFATFAWDLALPELINLLLPLRYPTDHENCGTHRELFGPTDTLGRFASTAVGVAAADAPAALDVALSTIASGRPFPGAIGNRLVRGTQATLGFTRFDTTCVLEIDGIDCSRSQRFYESFWTELERAGIDHSVHWGKMYGWTPQRMVARCGQDRLDRWLAARSVVLPTLEQRQVFQNGFLEAAGVFA